MFARLLRTTAILFVLVPLIPVPAPAHAAPTAAPCDGGSRFDVVYGDPNVIDFDVCLWAMPGGGYARVRRDDGKIVGAFSVANEGFFFRDDGLSANDSHTYYFESVSSAGQVTPLGSRLREPTTSAGGTPIADVTWAGGEVQVAGVRLPQGVTLTILPGTLVVDRSDTHWPTNQDISLAGGRLYVDGALFRDGLYGQSLKIGRLAHMDYTQSRVTIVNSTFENTNLYVTLVGAERFEGNRGTSGGWVDFTSPRGDFSMRDNEFPNAYTEVDFLDEDPLWTMPDSLTLTGNRLASLTIDGCTSSDGWATCFTRYSGPVDVSHNRFSCPSGQVWLHDLDSPQIAVEGNRTSERCRMEIEWTGTGPFDRHIRANAGFAIRLQADGVLVEENQIVNTYGTVGIQVLGSDNQIVENVFRLTEEGAQGYVGIQLGGSLDLETAYNTVARNTVVARTMPLFLQWTGHNQVYDNSFRSLEWYLDMVRVDSVVQDEIRNNVFVGPGTGVPVNNEDACNEVWNGTLTAGTNVVGGPNRGGNYWSGYTGSDADGDGIGDTPYLFVDDCGDQYPLVAADLPELSVVPFALAPLDVTFDGARYLLPLDLSIQNSGLADAAAVAVRFSDNGGWSETRVIAQVAAGGTAALHVDWDLTPLLLAGGGAAEARLEVTVDPAQAIAEWNDGNNTYAAVVDLDARPRLLEVRPEYPLGGAYYLDNESVPNRLSVFVDWNGALPGTGSAPYGKVVFDLNGAAVDEPGQDWGAAHTYDLGSDFVASLACANNLLRIRAVQPVAGGELQSLEEVIQPTVFPFPGWVEWAIANVPGSDASFETRLAAPLVEYQYDFLYPEEPFEANWTPPAWVPYLGGEELGILETQGGFHLLGRSNGLGTVGAEGTTGLGLAAFTAQGRVFGQGEARFVCGESLDLTRAELGFEVQAGVEREMGLVDLIPAARAAEDWPVVGRVVRWVNESAAVKGSFTPSVLVLTLFEEQDDALAFVSGEGTGCIAARAELAVDPIEDLSASVYGGGEPYLTLQVPADPGYLREVGIDLSYGAAFQAWSFEAEYERLIHCRYPGTCSEPEPERTAVAGGWRLIPRSAAGARFTARAMGPHVDETLLLTGIYPRPQPALAVDGAQRLLAYVDDDPADPSGRGTEIALLAYDGAAWEAPVWIADDGQPDYAPALAFDGSGRGVVAWEHADLAGGITPTLDIPFAQSLEIHACAWDGVTCTVRTALTSNGLMDYAPRLARLTNGDVLALWQSGDGVDLMGTPAHPISLTTALWDDSAGSWGAPQAALGGLYDVTGLAFAAYSPTRAALVYARDVDGDLLTTDDGELYHSTYDGTAWSAPTRLTNDALPDGSPALAYDAAGVLQLVWLRDGALAWLDGSWDAGAAQVLHPAGEGGLLGFHLSRAANGNLALVWQSAGESGADPAYSLFDGASADWSAPQTLLEGGGAESAFAPAFGSDGTLYLAYRRTAVETVTRTVSLSPTLSYTVTNLPTPGPSDLAFLAHGVGRDLAWDGLAVDPADPAPGEAVTLTAVLRNAGDLTVAAPRMAFYDGATGIGGLRTLPALPAGVTATVTASWTLPSDGAVHTLRAVADPNGQLGETDETNNQASAGVNLPNLRVDAFYTEMSDGALVAVARLRNDGGGSVPFSFGVGVRAGDPSTGALLAEVTAAPPGAGEVLTLTVPLTDDLLLDGVDGLWLVVDAADEVAERDEGDNLALTAAGYLPDLALGAAGIAPQGQRSVTVYNTGPLTATGVALEVRRDGPEGALLYSGVVPTVPAGGSAAFPIPLPNGRYVLFVKADPLNAIPERDESNNAAVAQVTIRARLYLPLVLRG